MSRHFQLKPVVVEAVQWTGANAAEVEALIGRENFDVLSEQERANCDDPEATAAVFTALHMVWMVILDGQWIVKDAKGDLLRPIAPDVFTEAYEPVIA